MSTDVLIETSNFNIGNDTTWGDIDNNTTDTITVPSMNNLTVTTGGIADKYTGDYTEFNESLIKGSFSALALYQLIFLNFFKLDFPAKYISSFGSTQLIRAELLFFFEKILAISPVPDATSIRFSFN